MARAYKKTYLNGAMRNLAVMLDCGASGNPRYLVGVSGAELADMVVQKSGSTVSEKNDGTYSIGPEYWAGWVLAYYQWYSCRSFAYMQKQGLGINEVISMYHPLHEADLTKFVSAADNKTNIIERNKKSSKN